MSIRQYFTASNTLSCTLVLIAACVALARGSDEKFPHLLEQFGGDSIHKIHLISEVVQGDHKIQVEEYLDLNTYSQLIQLKWHQTATTSKGAGEHSTQQLTTHKINVLILNGNDKSVLYQYRPYECTSVALDGQIHNEGWKPFDLSSSLPAEEQAGALLAKSIVSTALDSPYLVRLPAKVGEASSVAPEKWVSGIAGLWLAAQFSENGEHPAHPEQTIAGTVLLREGVWRLYRAANLVIDYYMQREASGPSSRSGGQFEAPELIVVRRSSPADDGQQTINVFKLELDYSDQLAQNLFTLPIGFDCPANPALTSKGLYLRLSQGMQLMQFELVASRTRAADGPLVDVRTIELVQVRHPLDTNSRLTMFSSREDHYKVIQDHSSRLEYKLFRAPGSAAGQTQCSVEHLEYNVGDNQQQDHREPPAVTTNSNQIRFNINKLQLELSEFHLNFLLGFSSTAIAPVDSDKMRLLNRFDMSDNTLSELVFESDVPAEHLDVLIDLTGTHREYKMRVVRVYEQQRAKSTLDPNTRIRRAALRLVRVLLLVFDANRGEKLAEVRLNLIGEQQILGWTERAHLLDLTRCRNLKEESMQLVVRYPAEPALLDYIDEHPSLLLERFYGASTDWLPTKMSGPGQPEAEPRELAQKRRLGVSLNYLRVPKAELRRAPGGDLELHLTILEATSPLESFELISSATFTTSAAIGNATDSGEQAEADFELPLLVGSVRECARLCQHFGCKVFAYEPSRECRMSHLALEDQDFSCKRRAVDGSEPPTGEDQARRGRRVKLVGLPMSELYFEPQHLRKRADPGEASLAELSSYIAHASYELEEHEGKTSDDQEDPATERQKRQVSPERLPLFAFDFIDRSGAQSEFAPPAMRLLVPSEVNIRYLPLVLNIARDGPQMERVSRSFSVRYTGKAYKLTALDASDPSAAAEAEAASLINENGRLFRDASNEVYYNLKQVASIGQDNCALLCHNIEEFNSQTGGEQMCISFSYSASDEHCVLLVKTDFQFLEKPNVVGDMAHEGDRVLELTGGPDGALLDQLMTKSIGGIVAFRNYLPEFQGPLKIHDSASGYNSTRVIEEEYRKRGLELEWLETLVVESDGRAADNLEDIRERCAQKCLERNRHLKRADSNDEEMCLALDHCASSTPLKGRKDNPSLMHHKQVCRLLLIRGEQLRTRREHVKPIGVLRSQLARLTNSPEANLNSNSNSNSNKENGRQPASTCNRYILSHLHEFNHLSQRQLLVTPGSVLSSKLAKSSETSYDSNLDTCALECSLRPLANCLMFEFCQTVKTVAAGSGQSLERNCTMFKRADSAADYVGRRSESDATSGDEFAQQLVTSFNGDCHVYVRRQFSSIEQALSDETLERLAPIYGLISREFAHTRLAIGFSILFLLATAGLVVFVVHLNRRYGSTNRRDAAIMMTEINKRLART